MGVGGHFKGMIKSRVAGVSEQSGLEWGEAEAEAFMSGLPLTGQGWDTHHRALSKPLQHRRI